MQNKDFLIVGGDKRMVALQNKLQNAGYMVHSCYREEKETVPDFSAYNAIILPIPAATENAYLNCGVKNKPYPGDILDKLQQGQMVFGGMLPKGFCTLAEARGVFVFDYGEAESFQQKNAYLTAEGAVSLAVQHTDIAILNAKCLVVGYGRIAKILAQYLKTMGARVTVAARHKDSLALAKEKGFVPCSMSNVGEAMQMADMVFNTVPMRILNAADLSDSTLYMELASKPYGLNMENATKNLLLAAGLPGKLTPKTAGEIIADTVLEVLNEKRGE